MASGNFTGRQMRRKHLFYDAPLISCHINKTPSYQAEPSPITPIVFGEWVHEQTDRRIATLSEKS